MHTPKLGFREVSLVNLCAFNAPLLMEALPMEATIYY